MYKKRAGTAGVHGQLFETKVLSLLNFRAKHDDDIEEFYLATNVDLIGEFDDICFRAKVKGFVKQMAMFVQTKHRETEKVLSLSIKHDLARYFGSYLKIRRAFGTKIKDKLFSGTFSETECLFVIYTNAKYDFDNELVETEYTTKLKELIGTNQMCSYLQPSYKAEWGDDDVPEVLSKVILEEEVVALAEHFAKLLGKEVMIDEFVSCYHYILAQKVFDIPNEINDKGHRIASFRNDFFNTNEHFVLIFRNTLYKHVLLKRKIDVPQILILLDKFFRRSSEVEVLSEIIVTVIDHKNGKFEFIKKFPGITEDLKQKLNKVSVSQSTVNEAIDKAARKILEQWKFEVPPSFGNRDLTIRGTEAKVESRLNFLTTKIVGLINDAKPNTIITIEECLSRDGLLKSNGGFAGLVGNVFVSDENSKFMKFADNIESIKGDLAKRLYLKLQNELNNLRQYKIHVKVKKFPKLSFASGEHEQNLVKDFLRQLIFFTNQSHEKEIGEELKRELGDQPYDGTHLLKVKTDAVFLKYHDAIQNWWVKPHEAEYLTKHSKLFENATKDIINQPLISVINMIHTFKMQNFKYKFNEAAVQAFKDLLDEQCKVNVNVIITDNCQLTVVKLTQYLNDKIHVVLDLECILNLLQKDYKTLQTELTEYRETLIFLNYGNWCERFNDIVKAVKTRLFIVTKAKPNKIVINAHDFENNLLDLSKCSQKFFLQNTKLIFQDEEVSLSLFLKDKKARKFIKGDLFHKMLENTIYKIGVPIRNQNYDEIKHLYTDRRVSCMRKIEDVFHEDKDKLIQTLYDLQEQVVLVTAMPGIGKSTLLTHLSIKTKELDLLTWIVRINLLEHSRMFSKWQKDKTVIDAKLSLYFMCYAALGVTEKDISVKLKTGNNVVSLKYCSGDAAITFGFEMFLHFYNSGTLIILFDGFDEIFPHYAKEALSLVKSVRSYPRKHKIWITSRSYNNIKEILEQEFGLSYDIVSFSDVEQKTYLLRYWINKILKETHVNRKQITRFVPCYHPFYSNHYYSIEQTFFPSFKVYFAMEDILKIKLNGYEDDSLSSTSNMAVRHDSRKNTYYTSDFFATPLHLYLLAECLTYERRALGMRGEGFVNLPGLHDKYLYSMEIMACDLYQHFVEHKLKKIRFKEKNKIDLSNPDNKMTYKREQAHVLSIHKKLGAYTIFYSDVKLIFDDHELKEVRRIIEMLKLGTEKSGFIHSVAGDIPLFIHKLIAEYFAAEYIDDLLKSDISDETRESILLLSKKDEVYGILAGKRIAKGKLITDIFMKDGD